MVSRLRPVEATSDPERYQNERFGHFNYVIPVAPGRYTVTLSFAETYFGPTNLFRSGVGLRVFNVYCNGRLLLKDFDITKEAGGPNRALDRTFTGVESNPQDKILLTFEPIRNYACVNAIEVVAE